MMKHSPQFTDLYKHFHYKGEKSTELSASLVVKVHFEKHADPFHYFINKVRVPVPSFTGRIGNLILYPEFDPGPYAESLPGRSDP
jgi:hypothetical protein